VSHLRRIRLTAGLRQRDVAERSGVTRETVALLEAGDRRPTLKTARAIAAALEVPVEAAFPLDDIAHSGHEGAGGGDDGR
jgi:putative transcriptional regulator